MRATEFVTENFAKGSSNDMSIEDMIAYLRQHHDKNLHPDYLDHLTNTNSKFVLKQIPLGSIRTELSGLDQAKVEQYKKMDFSKAPPIVVGSDGNILDGYHRATVAKALGITAIRAYVGVKNQNSVSENFADGKKPGRKGLSRRVGIPKKATLGPATVTEGFRRKLNFDEIYGRYLKVTDNDGDPDKEGFSLVTPLNGASWNWRERPEFKELVKRRLNQPGWLSDYKYQQIIDSIAGNKFDPARHLATENFADGKVKGKSRPGRVKRAGASCNGSVTDLRARAKKASGERAKMLHWCANMKSGKKKKK